ncbi:MAG: sugar porter family MFS transporter [Burkholderiales bacterium]|nr:sugar porter family MFS transporter [Burkholderiales bacterium]
MANNKSYLSIIIGVAATCGLLFGFDTSIIAGASPFIQAQFHATNFELEMVVSNCVLGALFGSLSSGYITDILGRRKVLIITGFIFIVGTILAATAESIFTLSVGRFVLGFGVGVGSFAGPLFIAEVAPAKTRGNLVLWNGAFITGGQVIAYIISSLLTENQSWRLMILTGILPAIILTIGMLCMPESPKWLALKGFEDKALDILTKIRGNLNDANTELLNIKNTLLHNNKIKLKEIFSKTLRPVLIIGLVLGVGQQFMGINTVMYYGPHIMKSIGFSNSLTQMFGTLGLGTTNFVFTIVTLLFIDRIGRRKFLLMGSMIAAISLFMMIWLLTNISDSQVSAYLAFVCLITYIIGYCISVGSLFWLMAAEIFPLNARGRCMSFVVAMQWGANFIVTSTFLTILSTLGMKVAFGIYGVVAILIFLFTLVKIPETRGVTLEVIESNLIKGVPSRYLGQKEI